MLGGLRLLLLKQEVYLFPTVNVATEISVTIVPGVLPIYLTGSYVATMAKTGSYTPQVVKGTAG